uniref:Uncharacterized protein n=1 Tax=Anguilla anguilla TaxID=7936 RepID=A0A0E9Q1D6_ANGAN
MKVNPTPLRPYTPWLIDNT